MLIHEFDNVADFLDVHGEKRLGEGVLGLRRITKTREARNVAAPAPSVKPEPCPGRRSPTRT